MVMVKEIRKEVGCEVVLLNPSQIALIYRSVKKNDKEIEGDRNIEKLEEIPGVGKQLASAYVAFLGDDRSSDGTIF